MRCITFAIYAREVWVHFLMACGGAGAFVRALAKGRSGIEHDVAYVIIISAMLIDS